MRGCVLLYREPLFRSHCETIGDGLYLELLPILKGTPRIAVGDNVRISGELTIECASGQPAAQIQIGDHVFIGHQVLINVKRRVVIDAHALIAGNCILDDSADSPNPAECGVLHIGRGAWLGRGCLVTGAVRIGEGAIVGAGSVVMSDIPPFAIAAGNPARVVRQMQSTS